MCDQVVEGNPCFEYVAYIVFPWFGSFEVTRNEKNGGNVTYTTVEQFKADYVSGALHPGRNASAADTSCLLKGTSAAALQLWAKVSAAALNGRSHRQSRGREGTGRSSASKGPVEAASACATTSLWVCSRAGLHTSVGGLSSLGTVRCALFNPLSTRQQRLPRCMCELVAQGMCCAVLCAV